MLILFELASKIYGFIPRRLKVAVARLAGRIVFWLNSRVRENTIANMAIVLELSPGDSVVRDLARESVMQYAVYAANVLDYYQASHEAIAAETTYDDPNKYLAQALARGKGVIFATGHFGNWDVAGAMMAAMMTLWVIQESFGDDRINEILRRIRESKNMKAVQIDAPMLPVLRGVLRGESVGVLIDRPTPGEGVEIEFFGRRTMVPDGVGRLAVRTGMPVVVGGAIRERDGTHTLVAVGGVNVDPTGPVEADVRQVTQAVFHLFEELIRRAPEQWYMFRNMWSS